MSDRPSYEEKMDHIDNLLAAPPRATVIPLEGEDGFCLNPQRDESWQGAD